MSHTPNHRRVSDRRRLPRGGRRGADPGGFAPLVLLVGDGDTVVAQSEAVLAKLRFAVTTTGTVEDALRVMKGLRPDVVVADADAASRLRREAPDHLRVVVMNDEMREDREALVEQIRVTIRATKRSP
jgi:CheY-like chemotaxis protein